MIDRQDLEKLTPPVRKTVDDLFKSIGDITQRLRRLEAQPMPPKGFLKLVAVGGERILS